LKVVRKLKVIRDPCNNKKTHSLVVKTANNSCKKKPSPYRAFERVEPPHAKQIMKTAPKKNIQGFKKCLLEQTSPQAGARQKKPQVQQMWRK
jgi:hypothetical protein